MEPRSFLRWVSGNRTPSKTFITRVFNFGTWEEWQAMKREFSINEIRDTVFHPLRGQWTRHGKALAEALFDCQIPSEALITYDAEVLS